MGKRYFHILLVTAAVLLLTGCNMRTIDKMYCLPKRSESYTNLQSQIDKAMSQAEYNAPISGTNRQSVQTADLDGDGESEYIVFAKSTGENPLQVFIFDGEDGKYSLVDTIVSTGTAFQQVEYARIDDDAGMEIVIGRQVSDQVTRSVNIYTMKAGKMQQLLAANYSKFVCSDMDGDGSSELLLFRPGNTEADRGVAELYMLENGEMLRSAQANMSEPADNIRRIMVSRLYDGQNAVFVASDVNENAIITDVFAIVDSNFANLTFSNDSGTSVQTLRSYYVYADDIDEDGILELPDLITMRMPNNSVATGQQCLIRWYAMRSDGSEVDKMFTYHNYSAGWYVRLDNALAERMAVVSKGNSYEFYLWNEENAEKLMTVHVLTGQKREEQAVINNRFVLYRTESTVYCGELEVASGAYGMSKDSLINSFRLIQQDWYTGET